MIFAGVPQGGGVKRQWGCQRRHFLAILAATASETLDRRPPLSAKTNKKAMLWQGNHTMPL